MSWGCYVSPKDVPKPGGKGWEAGRGGSTDEEILKLSFQEQGRVFWGKWKKSVIRETKLGTVKV